MKGLTKHILIFLGLVTASILLAVVDGDKKLPSFDSKKFVVKDTSSVGSIHIERAVRSVFIGRKNGFWQVNETFKADASLIRIFNAIMIQVQVLRPVSQVNFEEIKTDLKRLGQKVTIDLNGNKQIFFTGGNADKTKSYFANSFLDQIYVVGIPGYEQYLSGIFELTANQWRDRVLFDSDWRTLQSLKIDYSHPNRSSLHIYFEGRGMKVQGVNALDTTKLMTYLEQLDDFLLNDYLNPGQFPRYDSLTTTKPLAELTLKDIDANKNRYLQFYHIIDQEQFGLLTDANDQMIVLDKNRFNALLKSAEYFAAE